MTFMTHEEKLEKARKWKRDNKERYSKYQREYAKAHPRKNHYEYQKHWYKVNPAKYERMKARILEKIREYRDLIYDHYGNKCSCCGESTKAFLTIDHINGDGGEDRKASGNMYKRIVEAGFPDTLRLLCFNCNCGRERNGGICPHEVLEVRCRTK